MTKPLNSNKKEILNKGFSIFVIRGFGYFFGFIFIWLIANKYGPYTQGVFSIAFLFLSVGNMISKLGIETALVKWIAGSNDVNEKKKIYFKSIRIAIISSLLVATIIFLLASFISYMYDKPEVEKSIKLAAIAIPFMTLLDISSNYFKGERNTTAFGVYFHFLKFLVPLIVLAVFYFSAHFLVETPIISYLIGLSLVATTVFIHITKKLSLNKTKNTIIFSSKYMITEAYPMMISSAIVMLMGWSDIFILGFYVSEEKIGIYSTAIKLATIMAFLYNAIATIATPKIADYYKHNKTNKLKETISFSSKLIFLTSLPLFLVLLIFPHQLLSVFGEEYIEGKTVLRILLCAQFTNAITGLVGPIFQMTGHQRKLQVYILLSLLLNIVTSLILVNFYKLEGVAIGSAIGMVTWNIMGAVFIYRKMRLKTYLNF